MTSNKKRTNRASEFSFQIFKRHISFCTVTIIYEISLVLRAILTSFDFCRFRNNIANIRVLFASLRVTNSRKVRERFQKLTSPFILHVESSFYFYLRATSIHFCKIENKLYECYYKGENSVNAYHMKSMYLSYRKC